MRMLSMKSELIYTIPGWGFSADILKQGALADKTCFGLDYFDSSDLSIEGIALELAKAINQPSTLVAWSMGGLFATKIASLFPEKVKKLILLASQPRFIADTGYSGIDPQAMNSFIESAHQDFSRLKQQFINKVNFSSRNDVAPYFLEGCLEQLKTLLKILATADLREDYRYLKTEILHIMGSKDAVLRQDEQSLRKINSNITVVRIADAGHCGFLTHVLLYRCAIDRFISRVNEDVRF
jgi:pimeloyl-[acyl-carrier protein] methyl ester esterase